MTLEELLRDKQKQERSEGRAEGRTEGRIEGKAESIVEILSAKGSVPERLRDRILAEKEPEVLSRWLQLAVSAGSVSRFEEEM